MAQRIPFTIYRLAAQDSTVEQQQNMSPAIEAYQYLYGVTENDINRNNADPSRYMGRMPSVGTIALSQANFAPGANIPDTALISDLPVYASDNTQTSVAVNSGPTSSATSSPTPVYTVPIEGQLFYIRPTQSPESAVDPVPNEVTFYVNPQRIQFNKEKLISEVRTRGGWDIQHWGEKLLTITVDGITGGLHRDISKDRKPGDIGTTIDRDKNISSSTAWQRLRSLSALYDADHGKTPAKRLYKLAFGIFEDYYIGYFSNFTGPEIVADKPYLMSFSFVFKVEQKITESDFRLEYNRSVINSKGNNEVIPPGTLG